jgi:para-nitrobenzyl esterase
LRPLASLMAAEEQGRKLGNDLKAMRAMPAGNVLRQTSQFVPKVRGLTTPRMLRPIRDGWVIEQEERVAYVSGNFTPMPMIVGSNLDAGGLFVSEWQVNTLRDYSQLFAQNFGSLSEQALTLHQTRRDEEVREQCAFLFGDTQFTYGARGIATTRLCRCSRSSITRSRVGPRSLA